MMLLLQGPIPPNAPIVGFALLVIAIVLSVACLVIREWPWIRKFNKRRRP